MRRSFLVAVVLAWCWSAQSPIFAQTQGSAQNQTQQKTPDANTPKPKPQPEANPFPEDTTSVPVMPSNDSPGTPAAAPSDAAGYYNVGLPSAEKDPVRSPDDGDSGAASSEGSSSSSQGLDDLLKPPADSGKPGKNGHGKEDVDTNAVHAEGAKEDESVGSYYLDQRNWKAALSRFESALVLDPENPDVYWGLGEAERHLGNYANARTHYLKLVEYDPESKHGKEAKKLLKEPELANAAAASSNAPSGKSPQ